MSQAPNEIFEIQAKEAARSIAALRAKLLDLSNRNQLLNFKHTPRSRSHIRIIDEILKLVFDDLAAGKYFDFKPLPEPNNEELIPEDEKSDEFEMQLEKGRSEDPQYINAVEKLEAQWREDPDDPSYQEALARCERSFRDRLRTTLEMPPRKPGAIESIITWARKNDFNPSFDLTADGKTAPKSSYFDRYLQTLFLPEDLDRKLAGIFEIATLALNEKGVNTLYVALGFLEWYERADAETSMVAPLVLIPVEIAKSVTDGEIKYRIKPTGDEPQSNITLHARLRQDLQLELPEISSEEPIEDYLARVEAIIGRNRNWRIRRYITVGHFAFSRLVMYNDLDETKWPAERTPRKHELVRGMFGGAGGGPDVQFAEIYNPDDEVFAQMTPELVVDADSSQFSAVIDVLKGKNLVIQGPPGTGKSQTITNIIAAALAKNMRVLFVAEKMAALEVVMSRMRACGLGDLCLELHSTRAKKTHVVEALKKRLALRHSQQSTLEIDFANAEIQQAKEKIQNYLELVDSKFGNSDRKLGQILWRAHIKPVSTLSEALQKLNVADAETWTPSKQERVSFLLRELGNIEAALTTPPPANPWGWIRSAQLTPLDFTSIISHCRAALAAAEQIGREIAAFEKISRVRLPETHPSLLPIIECLGDSRLPAKDSVFAETFLFLASTQNATLVGALIAAERQAAILLSDIAAHLKLDGREPKDCLGPLLAITSALPTLRAWSCTSAGRIVAKIGECESGASDFDQLSSWIDRVARLVRLTFPDKNAALIEQLQQLGKLTSALTPEILADRKPARLSVGVLEVLDEIQSAWNIVQVQSRTLQASLKFDEAEVDQRTLASYRQTIAEAGLLGFLNSDFRAARRYTRGLFVSNPWPSKPEMLAALDNLVSFCEARDRLLADERTRALLGTHYNGWRSDFQRIRRVADWAQSVHRSFEGNDGFNHGLRQFLFVATTTEAAGLQMLFQDPVAAKIPHWLTNGRVMLDDLVAASARLRALAEDFRILQHTAEEAGLSPSFPFSSVAELTNNLHEHAAKEAGRLAALTKLQALLGTEDIDSRRPIFDQAQGARDAISGNSALPDVLKVAILHQDGGMPLWNTLAATCASLHEPLNTLSAELAALQVHSGETDSWTARSFPVTQQLLEASLAVENDLASWLTWLRTMGELEGAGARAFHQEILDGTAAGLLSRHFEHILYRSLANRAHQIHPKLRQFNGVSLTEAQHRFRSMDHRLKRFSQQKIISFVCQQQPPTGNGYGSVKSYTEMALLRNEVGKSTRHIPLRDLLSRAGAAIQTLMPCFMMSPMSVAQFLRRDGLAFDIVVFDEASQVLPEDALGALLRGKQVVVVGDQMQLPPTDFFKKADSGQSDDMDEEEAAAITGMESILDKALAVFQPARRLLWHYRSRDPRLIAYSNREFYNKELQIFPAPHEQHALLGIHVVEVNGVYSGRANVLEARAIAEAAVAYMQRHPDQSLGLVSLNSTQRDIISHEVNRLLAREPKAAEYCEKWQETLEPFFVKNLENVQGDERDCIFISTVFGKNAEGNFHQRFGPINSAVGHRRLNVLFTRAKETVVLFTSIGREDILIDESSSRGRVVLRGYLDYARTKMLDSGDRTYREPDSDFEVMVRERLKIEGFTAECQVGVAGYFVDLAVRHPAYPSSYVLGVECDGASYHSFKSVRDRDRLRQEILERLGWRIHRIWSTDWFQNPDREISKLVQAIRSQIEVHVAKDAKSYLDFTKFANLAALQRPNLAAVDQRRGRVIPRVDDMEPTSVPLTPPIDLLFISGAIAEEFNARIAHHPEELRLKLAASVAFKSVPPMTELLLPSKTGRARILDLEEQYTRLAFNWIMKHPKVSLENLTWIKNLNVPENLELREVAITCLIKYRRI